MNTRERLANYTTLLAEKREIELQIAEMEDTELQGVGYDSIGTSYEISNSTEKLGMRRIRAGELLTYKVREIERIDNSLRLLNNRERKVIELKYFKGYSWERVVVDVDRHSKTCRRIEEEAIRKIESILNYKIQMS